MQARYFTGLKHVTLDVLHMGFLRVTRVTFSQCSHAHDARTPHHFVMIVVGWGPKPPGNYFQHLYCEQLWLSMSHGDKQVSHSYCFVSRLYTPLVPVLFLLIIVGMTTEGFQSLDVYPLANSVDRRATVGIDLLATFLDRSTTDLVAEPDSCISLFNIVKYSRPIKVKYNYIP